ncbi:chromate transporter [Acidilutibacter cellobiosedens]|jgi:chromate transporter|uniref:Chromate transporter n=1 Tax=Acidilutibacter cellobiosedens TaxID=2507161 RepID=A0A410QFJ8_9FIRM|nr:chromate transporter [Acidilutibacter cellobiosedens]QAT62853.1 chromate transporter [Acidilutibacter cellobiosedens]
MITELMELFLSFLKIGFAGFGGGYAMLSMILSESHKFGITLEQFADLNALDMIVPGPIAINAATYVGYLSEGFWGALFATVGVSLPSFILVVLVMRFFSRYRESHLVNDILSGIKPAAVGLIAAAALTIALGIILLPGQQISNLFSDPLGTVSFVSLIIFVVTAFLNIKFDLNPILLTLIAGIVGTICLK